MLIAAKKTTCPVLPMLAVLALTPLAAGCQARGQEEDAAAQARRPVRVAMVSRADIVESIEVPAELKPYTEVRIYSQIPDRILFFPFRDGDFVKRGQRIALIRREGLERGLERMVAEEQALEVQLRNLKQELERSRELLRSGVITQPAFDKLKTTYQATRARRQALRAGRSQLAVQAGNAVIRSPISGVVAGATLEVGDMAVPQVPLCRVLDIARLRIALRLTESEATKVAVGQAVNLELDCCPEEKFPASVTRIYPYIDPATRTNTVEVVLENPRDDQGNFRLKPGMFGSAQVVLARRPGALVVPEPALLLDNELLKQQKTGQRLRLAFVVEDDTARRRVVVAGARKGELMEIVKGLRAGERVIVSGQHGLRDGEPVHVVGENGQ